MSLSRHFKRKEFACKCGCGFDTVDAELLYVLEDVRRQFAEPVTVTSGCRCVAHNEKVGGSENSKHIKGIAADIKVKDIDAREVYEYLNSKYPDKYGIGKYTSWTHIDVREERKRW